MFGVLGYRPSPSPALPPGGVPCADATRPAAPYAGQDVQLDQVDDTRAAKQQWVRVLKCGSLMQSTAMTTVSFFGSLAGSLSNCFHAMVAGGRFLIQPQVIYRSNQTRRCVSLYGVKTPLEIRTLPLDPAQKHAPRAAGLSRLMLPLHETHSTELTLLLLLLHQAFEFSTRTLPGTAWTSSVESMKCVCLFGVVFVGFLSSLASL